MTSADTRPDEISTVACAEILGVSPAHFRVLQRKGYIPRTRHGKTALIGALAGYVRHLGEEAARTAAPAPILPDLPAELAAIGDQAGRRLRAAGADLPALRRVLAAVEAATREACDA